MPMPTLPPTPPVPTPAAAVQTATGGLNPFTPPSYARLRALQKRTVPFLNFRTWHLHNTDTGQTISGQFEAKDLKHTAGSRYNTHYVMGRSHPITQFISGELEVVSFLGTTYAEHILQNGVEVPGKLHDWAQVNIQLGRPPILEFWVGDGFLSIQCLLEPVEHAFYELREFGRSRGAVSRISLRRYDAYDLAQVSFDTRYHRVGQFDYYEMLAWREYGNPMFGVFLAQDHRTVESFQIGTVVRLPSAPSFRRRRVSFVSEQFSGLDQPGDSPQHKLLAEVMADASKSTRI